LLPGRTPSFSRRRLSTVFQRSDRLAISSKASKISNSRPSSSSRRNAGYWKLDTPYFSVSPFVISVCKESTFQ